MIRWSPEAIADLSSVREYIARHDPAASRRVVVDIIGRIEQQLPRSPNIGRPGRVPGTRELVVTGTPFVVPYRHVQGTIEILRIFHGARRWSEQFS